MIPLLTEVAFQPFGVGSLSLAFSICDKTFFFVAGATFAGRLSATPTIVSGAFTSHDDVVVMKCVSWLVTAVINDTDDSSLKVVRLFLSLYRLLYC